MNTVTIRHGLPVRTTDAAFNGDVGRILHGIKNSLGLLSPDDLNQITAILEKYSPSTEVGPDGSARMGDALDAGREGGARVRRQLEHTAKVASGYKTFWDAKEAELKRYGQR